MNHSIADALGKAIGSLRADDDMFAVLNALEDIGARHVEDLEPAEARRQPTVADAVVALLERQGKSTGAAACPPVTTITAQIDPLRSDGAKMEAALRKAGVAIERRDVEGVTHEFFGTATVVAMAREAQHCASARLRGAFGGV